MDPLDQPASAVQVRRLAAGGLLGPAEAERALALAGVLPSPRAWVRFGAVALLVAGTALCLAGLFFFFAYNWADLHRFAKFALLQAAVLMTASYALWRGLERLDAQVALFAACALVGALLAVFGQVYQMGADSYTLFLSWAALIAIPTFLARNAPLWMLLVALLNLSLFFAWEQRLGAPGELRDDALFALNALAVGVWAWARGRGNAWMRPSAYERALFALATCCGSAVLLDVIEGSDPSVGVVAWLAPLAALALAAVAVTYYLRRAPDLVALSLLALAAIVVLTAQAWRWIGSDDAFGVLALGVLVLAQVAVATLLLLRAARRMGVLR
ncbi:MAG: hypothetical protein OHK0015_39100 [Chloroflexi bacterium OHK40]